MRSKMISQNGIKLHERRLNKGMYPQLESNMRNQIIISNIKVEDFRNELANTKFETERNILYYLLLDITLFDKIVNEWKWKVHILI